MKNTWLRELREKTGIDERRRENSEKMRTALQKPKKQREAEKAAANDAKKGELEEAATSLRQKTAEEKQAAAALAMMPSVPLALGARAESV